jgi:histidinol dehydrogenase
VGALAYGVEGIAPVDKIVGPGNLFVALAKKAVYGQVDIDSIAGPSEVLLIADETARPEYIAADLISQAEHSPGSSLLVTWVPELIEQVAAALENQLAQLSRGDLARDALEQYGALIRVADADAAIELSNQMAPEHLHVSTADPLQIAERLTNAGAMFLGHDTPVAAGDYAAGPSHVLPTGATARWASGLTANHFLRTTSMIHLTAEGLRQIAPEITHLADVEGLTAHKASVTIRTEGRIEGGK